MPRFYHPDDLPQRHPTELQAMVNTIGAISDEERSIPAFVATHLADVEMSSPSILASLWTAEEAHDPELGGERLEWTVSLTPDQARALGWALLRLADGLEAMAEMGEIDPEELAAQASPIYWIEPTL